MLKLVAVSDNFLDPPQQILGRQNRGNVFSGKRNFLGIFVKAVIVVAERPHFTVVLEQYKSVVRYRTRYHIFWLLNGSHSFG